MNLIPFAEWIPDQPVFGNQGATIAKNVLPGRTGYKPIKTLTAYSGALTAHCRGAISMQDVGGNTFNFAGDETKLYSLANVTWSSVGGATYTTTAEERWEFVKWGDNCIATNFNDVVQIKALASGNFGALGGTPPKARHIAVVRDFVVLGNVFSVTNMPNRVWWSGINDEDNWTPALATQCDWQDIQGDGGAIQKVIGGEIGIIFQQRAIHAMTYVGSPLVFQFDEIESNRGAYAPGGVAKVGNKVFYLSHDGFYVLSGGVSIPIGAEKVNQWFFDNLETAYKYRIASSVDPTNNIVMWIFPDTNSRLGTPNKAIIYNWATDRWSYAQFDSEFIYPYMSTSETLEGLNDIAPSGIDSLTVSLDASNWKGGHLRIAAFDTAHKLAFFSGTSMVASVETGEFDAAKDANGSLVFGTGRRSTITNVKPIIDGGNHAVQIGTRNNQTDSVEYIDAAAQISTGDCPIIISDLYHRIRVNTEEDFHNALGVQIQLENEGWR